MWPVKAVHTVTHQRHHPRTEVASGQVTEILETPSRAEAILAALAGDHHYTLLAPTDHGLDPILAVHDPGLVRFLEEAWDDFLTLFPRATQAVPDSFSHPQLRDGMAGRPEPSGVEGRLGYWGFDTATPIVGGTYPAARAAVDVALTASDLVFGGEPVAYGLCRPPGHHAPRAAFGGYCYLNNAAVAAADLVRRSGGPVAVLDLDYHHGNGTQQIFYDRADVQYVSLHGDPNRAYPYFTGFADETGAGKGLGRTMNIPLPPDVDDDAYLEALAPALDAVDQFDPAVLVVSLGLDTFIGDPLGDLRVTHEGYARIGAAVADLGRPPVVLQEGGYRVADLGVAVRAFLTAMDPPRRP